METNKSKITWAWIILVASFGIPMLLASSTPKSSTALGLIMQIASLVLGVVLWRSAEPTEKKNGMAITIIWLVISGLGFMIGLVLGASGMLS